MALATDAAFMIHMMRIKFLRMDERGERIVSFRPTIMSDDYIRLAAPAYPEMQYCYSPVNEGLASGSNLLTAGLKSSPRTQRSHYQLRKKRQIARNVKRDATSSEDEAKGDDHSNGRLSGAIVATRKVSDASIRRTGEMTNFSHGNGSENANTPLHPSVDSNIDPSPRSSFDVVDSNQASSPTGTSMAHIRSGTDVTKPRSRATSLPQHPLQHTKISPSLQRHGPVGVSALSALIAEKACAAENPFAEYSHVSGKGESNPITLCVFLPHSNTPFESVSLVVRPDAIIDDVIGYILYDYEEQRREPEIESEAYDLAQWALLIAEDDGEIEDDLPALDRTRRIDQVSFDQFALCRVNATQAKQNEQIRAKLGRTFAAGKAQKKSAGLHSHLLNVPSNNPSTAAHGNASAAAGTGIGASSSAPCEELLDAPSLVHQPQSMVEPDPSTMAVPVPSSKAMLTKSDKPLKPIRYLKILLKTNDMVEVTTMIEVYEQMFVGDVLDFVSRKRKLDKQDYILMIPGGDGLVSTDTPISNDTPVSELNNIKELTLKRRSDALKVPASSITTWRGRSPIKKKKDEPQQPMYFSSAKEMQPSVNLLSQYKKYSVNRKIPMFVGKRANVLTIDGDYIYLMPPEQKGMLYSDKTISIQASSIQICKQSEKPSNNFKIKVKKEGENKTYEFEAESSKDAYEICAKIQHQMRQK